VPLVLQVFVTDGLGDARQEWIGYKAQADPIREMTQEFCSQTRCGRDYSAKISGAIISAGTSFVHNMQ
jgi:hypothetical protein